MSWSISELLYGLGLAKLRGRFQTVKLGCIFKLKEEMYYLLIVIYFRGLVKHSGPS